ncbi:hypothetical protein VP01_1927g1 [Puccinia sorghi]|uniref:Uncharacterized protein n=1 Tax=Puccinia sorghi TaxID=27349 RepID=A0A0L6VCM4_9BASI|nr:hypothetical protein VP01_1927g1 [Puccinia sorghi]
MTGTHPNKRTQLMYGTFVTMGIVEDNLSSESDEDEEQIEDIMLDGGLDGRFFSEGDVQRFCEHMKYVFLPPGVPHLPSNLGEAKHGKLSASQWLALWVFISPLVILEMYINQVRKIDVHSNLSKFLFNTAHPVQ